MRSRLSSLSAVLAAAALCPAAFAGDQSAQNVVIISAASAALGDVGHVHNSPDDVQYIGCEISGSSGTCHARDKSGQTRSCTTTNATHLNTILSVTSDSYIYFRWNSEGLCAAVKVENGSMGRPKE